MDCWPERDLDAPPHTPELLYTKSRYYLLAATRHHPRINPSTKLTPTASRLPIYLYLQQVLEGCDPTLCLRYTDTALVSATSLCRRRSSRPPRTHTPAPLPNPTTLHPPPPASRTTSTTLLSTSPLRIAPRRRYPAASWLRTPEQHRQQLIPAAGWHPGGKASNIVCPLLTRYVSNMNTKNVLNADDDQTMLAADGLPPSSLLCATRAVVPAARSRCCVGQQPA